MPYLYNGKKYDTTKEVAKACAFGGGDFNKCTQCPLSIANNKANKYCWEYAEAFPKRALETLGATKIEEDMKEIEEYEPFMYKKRKCVIAHNALVCTKPIKDPTSLVICKALEAKYVTLGSKEFVDFWADIPTRDGNGSHILSVNAKWFPEVKDIDIVYTVESEEYCDWCMGGAMDLVYSLEDSGVGGEIDASNGEMAFLMDGMAIGSRIVNFCPMCGRPLGRGKKHE